MKLYEFAISHYCEKVRWALDYKGIDYETKVLAPGPSAPLIYFVSGGTTVPVIDDNGRRMNESADIIEHLEHNHPGPSIYPEDAAERKRALELVAEFDKHLGHDVRRVAYWYILPDAGKTRELLTTGLAGWRGRAYGAISGVMGSVIRRNYRINEKGFERSNQRVMDTLALIERERDGREYLVGSLQRCRSDGRGLVVSAVSAARVSLQTDRGRYAAAADAGRADAGRAGDPVGRAHIRAASHDRQRPALSTIMRRRQP